MALTALLLTFAFGLVRSQQATFGVCDPAKTTSGFPITGHPQTCAKFIFCQFEREYQMDCPVGTLYNKERGICDILGNFNCDAWKDSTGQTTCGANRVQLFAASCCGGYYSCDRGTVKQLTCDNNRPFNNNTNACDPFGAECTTTNRCSYANASASSPRVNETCARLGFSANPNDACGYLRNNSGTITAQKCPTGTLFNYDQLTETCGCIQATSGPCVVSAQTVDGSADQCSAEAGQFKLRVNNFKISAMYKGASSWVDVRSGVDVTTDAIRFARTGDNVALIPFFANNDRVFKKDFGIQVLFRGNNLPLDTDIDILSNEEGTSPSTDRNCDPSLYLKVRKTSSGQWTVTYEVKDASGQRQTISADVTSSRGEWLRVTSGVTQDGQMRGIVEVADNANLINAFKQPMTTRTIAVPIQTVKCNLGVGRRYNRPNNLFGGEIRELTVFLNCVGVASLLQ